MYLLFSTKNPIINVVDTLVGIPIQNFYVYIVSSVTYEVFCKRPSFRGFSLTYENACQVIWRKELDNALVFILYDKEARKYIRISAKRR